MSRTKSTTTIENWTIRGIDQATRAAARVAARKAGKTIGEWVNDALIKAAHEETSSQSAQVGPTMTSMMERLLTHIEKTDARLEALEAKKTGFLWLWNRGKR